MVTELCAISSTNLILVGCIFRRVGASYEQLRWLSHFRRKKKFLVNDQLNKYNDVIKYIYIAAAKLGETTCRKDIDCGIERTCRNRICACSGTDTVFSDDKLSCYRKDKT